MPTWLVIVLVALALIVIVLALGGGVAVTRRRHRDAASFEVQLEEANRALAAAHAQDKGWEPEALREAARRAFEVERPGVEIRDMALVQVVDRPGIEEDEAVFRFETADGNVRHLTLDRSSQGWSAAGAG
jgi:hypothetical protein